MEKVSLQNRISSIAQKTPDKKAVEWGSEYITYLELEQNSNRIANFLTAHVGENKRIPVIMEQSISLIEGLLGIIKSGNIFVPIDPNYPANRIKTVIKEIGSDWMISQAATLQQIEAAIGDYDNAVNVLLLEPSIYHKEKVKHLNIFQIDSQIEKDYLLKEDISNMYCYIYFTSGSTGKPKGILGRHRSLDHFIQWEIGEFGVNEAFRVSQLTSPSFDPFLRDVFVPLCAGSTLCIPDNKDIILDPEKLVSWIEKNQITLVHTVPVLFKNMMSAIETSNCFGDLRYVLLAGEILRGNDIRKFIEIFSDRIQLVNLYGPTETTLAKFFYRIKREDTNRTIMPVGIPITFAEALILNQELNKCEVNVPGEIFIRTPFISSGYFNDRELTKKVFIKNPFSSNEQDIIYKTGDMGRLLPDGNIEVIGRVDSQVKIRGSRIETVEVENQLLKHEAVKEAVVAAWEDKSGDKYLCAYVTGNWRITAKELREYLRGELPEYMIPSYFVQVDRLPLTPNRKIDRKALPEPDGSIETGAEYEAPRNETEETLVGIWQEVLKLDKIGINDNFFELGGHSLKATNMVSKIHKELNVEVPLGEVFKTPTIKGLSEYMKEHGENIYSAIEPVEEKECYGLSSAQKRLYTLQQFDLESTGYNIPKVLEIEGKLDVERLENAFGKLIERHEALRTSFELIEEEILQRVHKEAELEIEHKKATEEDVEGIVRSFIRPFDLNKAPLLRVGLIKLHPERHILMYDMHHIISDGTSIGILTDEFVKLYKGQELSPLRLQYKDYAAWQNSMLNGEAMKKQEEHWLKTFRGELPVLNLLMDYQRPAMQSFEGDSIHFELSEEMTRGLRRVAKETGATIYMVLLAGFNILLSKYSGQEDIVIGSPIAGRPYVDLENIMGMFVNTLAMRNYPEGSKTIREFIEEVKTKALRAYENQDYQFEELVEKLKIRRDMSRNPMFDVMFILQNMDRAEIAIEGINIKQYNMENRVSKFDMTLTAVEAEEKIGLSIEYCSRLFKKETIERMAGHLNNVLKEIEYNTDKRICEIEISGEEERHKLLYEFNNTYKEYPRDKTIQELLEEQVARTPDNIAVIYENQQLTYMELNKKANQLARVLRNKGVKPDNIVGMMAERSIEMIVGIIGILKAGGSYLPIDPEYPGGRIEYILEDSEAGILLIQDSLRDNISFKGEVIELDNERIYEEETGNLERVNNPDDLAYVIYTSGSTGKPKGVMLHHRGINNHTFTKIKELEITKSDVLCHSLSVSFVASIWQIFSPLIIGAKLLIYPQYVISDASKLFTRVVKDKVSIVEVTPTLINAFLDSCEIIPELNELKAIVLTGEQVKTELARKFYDKYKTMLVNAYGQSECSDDTLHYHIPSSIKTKSVLIGRPSNNTNIYIIDKYNNLQPIGAAGEICIAGDGLARGYLNKQELTAEKFVDNPFEPGTKMYRTGDLARWLPDGNMEFIGRTDHQVKIRGFRIELGEIESQLVKHPDIKEAIVTTKEGKGRDKYLCAYIAAGERLKVMELREYLGKTLPDYMIPSYFVQLDKIPLTPNGKVDRKALPEPDGSMATGVEYEAPRNEVEEKLVKIWQEVLGIEKIGINDSFFELGGHSLKATSMAAKIHKQLNVEMPLREIFKAPTIKGITEYISRQEESIYAAIEKVEEKDYYEMSSAQKRLYTLQQFDRKSTGYNMSGVMEIEGKLNEERLETAFRKLIERHETLRTSFEQIGEEIVQKVHKEVIFGIERLNNQLSTETKEFIRPFDLSKAPLLRVGLIKLYPEKHILMYDMHHIISDGTSMGILTDEFVKLYEGQELSPLKIQYKDYAAWQNDMLRSDVMKKQEEYWLKQLSGCASTVEAPVLDLLADYPRPELQSFEGGSIWFEIDEVVTKALRNVAKETGVTMYMVLLAGFNILLSKCSGQEDIIVGSPIANRQHADLEKIIGMFANTLAIRNYPCGDKTFKDFLMELKSNSLRAYENQDYQFEELVDKLNIKRDMSRNPIFDTMFVVQNMQMKESEIEGLKFKNREGDSGISRLDITVEAIEDEKINMRIQYSRHLFKKETVLKLAGHLKKILTDIANNTELKISEIEIFEEEEKKRIEEKRRLASDKKAVTLAVAATFTAEPIEEYIRWWCGKYGEKIEVIFAPYNQIFQQLLDTESVISKNKGLNLLLVRFEDWIRDMQEESEKAKCEIMEGNYNKLIELIGNTNKNALNIIGVFPVSSHLELSSEVADCIMGLNYRWQEAMTAMENVSVIDFRETAELYGIKEIFDPVKDKVGHMPFSDEYYAAIGTMTARRINAIKGNPFKVIAVDCDNTLWQGICGEDGALGVKVEEPHMELQKQLIKLHEEGMLIVLCSKNNEADVWEVFDNNPQMILKKEHLAAWKINWEPKSESIRKLAKELNLGIDSFIFIDDSGVECCGMMTNNPEVLTLQLPEDPKQIPMYLRHVWAFDKVKVTEEDLVRTKSYQIERQRKEIQKSYTMEDFIKELALKINISEIEKEHIARVSQLTQRTNQFNLSTIRRTEEEVEELLRKPEIKGWKIEVEDKFGDYGLTGVVIMEKKEESIYLDTLLLSCRVLGRRVEAEILSELGNYCRSERIKRVKASYYPTAKNQIVKECLEKGGWNIAEESSRYTMYEILTADMPESIEHIECSYGKKEKKDRTVEVIKGLECILDHIGVEVNDIKASKEYYKTMGYIDSDIIFDPQQSAYLALCSKAGFDTIELVNRIDHETVFEDSDRIYHMCYRVKSFTEVFERMKYCGIEWELISEAKPAVIFEGKEVLFIQVKGVGLVEFLQDVGIEQACKEASARLDTVRLPVTDKENALKYYDMLGYVEADRKYDGVNKVLSITLSRNGSGRIELLAATELSETLKDICRICYECAAEAASSMEYSDVTEEERYGSLNKAVLVMQPKEAKYSIYYSLEKEEREPIEMNWQISMEKEAELLHKSYILPIRHYTGKLLLSLPVYENEKGSASKRIYEAPRNEIEEKLVKIWQEVLQTEKIGINDNFFELGGHSIKATRVVSKIYKEWNEELSLREIFKYPTIKQFAENVLQGGKRERTLLNKLTKDNNSKELTLVCIPYGGGNSVVYQPFADELSALSEEVEVYSLALPGHDFREEDTEERGVLELAELYTEEIKRIVRTPIVLYGHCVGGALTCELARQLTINKLDLRGVILGGVMPVKRTIFGSIKTDPFGKTPDKAILEFLRGVGGFEEDMEDSELAFIMENFRKDVKISQEYYYNYYPTLKNTEKPKVPVYCIVGDKDPLTKGYSMRYKGWKHYFAGKIYLKVIKEAKHYFIKYQARESAEIVKEIIDSTVLNSVK